jgi:hypothetical protein
MGFHVFYLSEQVGNPDFPSTREDDKFSEMLFLYIIYILLYILTLGIIQSKYLVLKMID